jgi:hypothetical protein
MKINNLIKAACMATIFSTSIPFIAEAYPIKSEKWDLVVVGGKAYDNSGFYSTKLHDGKIHLGSIYKEYGKDLEIKKIIKKRKIILGNHEYDVKRIETPKGILESKGEFLFYEYENIISSDSLETLTSEQKKKIEFTTNVLCFIEQLNPYLDDLKAKKRILFDHVVVTALLDQKIKELSKYSSKSSESSYYNNELDNLYLDKKNIRKRYNTKIKNLEIDVKRIDKQIEELRVPYGTKILDEWVNVIKGTKGSKDFLEAMEKGSKSYTGTDLPYKERVKELEEAKEDKKREIDNLYEYRELDLSRIEQRENYIKKQLKIEKKAEKQEKIVLETSTEQLETREQMKLDLYRSLKKIEQMINPTFENFIYSMPKNPSLRKGKYIHRLLYSSHLIPKLEQELKKYESYIRIENGIKTMNYQDALKINDQANIFEAKINTLNHGKWSHFENGKWIPYKKNSEKTWHGFFSDYKESVEDRFGSYFWNYSKNMKVDVPE